jgi:ABC-2 type transport system ATP-binding protein
LGAGRIAGLGATRDFHHGLLSMLRACGLTKRFGGLLALDKVSFELHPGEIVGYLGPNGSGKSTTVNLVVGLLEPSAGSLSLGGLRLSDDPVGYKRRIGYVPEEPYLYTHLTAAEYLTLVGRLRGIGERPLAEKTSRLLRLFQLHDSRYKTMSAYSKGMRQRVLLAAALLHNPDLLVLDEPFSGLDVNAGLLFRALLGQLAAEGKMVLFSTHRFDMVEKLCSRVVILSAGRLVAERRMAELDRTGAGALEDIFVRVTEQPDFTPVAQEILDTIRAG